jgi:hypothetical protein
MLRSFLPSARAPRDSGRLMPAARTARWRRACASGGGRRRGVDQYTTTHSKMSTHPTCHRLKMDCSFLGESSVAPVAKRSSWQASSEALSSTAGQSAHPQSSLPSSREPSPSTLSPSLR